MRLTFPLLAALALSACAAVPPPVPPVIVPPPSPPAPPQPPTVAPNWQDGPIATGDWTFERDASGPVARFGQPGLPAELLVRCIQDTRLVQFFRAGALGDGVVALLTLSSTDGSRAYRTMNSGSVPAYVRAETPANDPALDRLAFSRGRFLVAVPGTADLVVPSWPEFARIIEDCRG